MSSFSGSNYEVAELTWENGQLALHGHGGILPTAVTPPTTKLTWGRTNDTLESIVHQATTATTTCHHNNPTQQNINLVHNDHHHHQNLANISSIAASSSGKWADSSGHVQMAPSFLKKRPRSTSQDCGGRNFSSSIQEDQRHRDRSVCASVSATISRDNDTTMMTWPSFESPNWSFKSNTTDDNSACQDRSENQEAECKTKGETVRSHSSRRSRAAAVHNQSERRRRDRINQKMKALQKLVPNASKTDKGSMLDEVIEYLKQLQAQVQMMNSVRNIPQMMMPLQQMQQQQLQMSLLARMGIGVGLGMGIGMMPQPLPRTLLHHQTPVAASAAAPTFVPPPFTVPTMINPQARQNAPATNTSVPFSYPYSAFLAQSMNIDLYNKTAALYQQQVNQAGHSMTSPSRSNHVQGE